jgi:hypothetical protein
MIELANDQLVVELLDPEQDLQLLGTRYTRGGSIYQIYDLQLSSSQNSLPLLSGPTYPESYNIHDGQGIPDSFSSRPLDWQQNRESQLILGVGVCDMDKHLISKSKWIIQQESASLVMFSTSHKYYDGELVLTREVELNHRTIQSRTSVENFSSQHAPIAWYPHPFFPQPQGQKLIRMNVQIPSQALVSTSYYNLAQDGWIYRTLDYPESGAYWALEHYCTSPLWLILNHDQLGKICFETDYVPGFFPLWGNNKTISFEPYMERQIPRRGSHRWSATYHL